LYSELINYEAKSILSSTIYWHTYSMIMMTRHPVADTYIRIHNIYTIEILSSFPFCAGIFLLYPGSEIG